jgi:hypothetical protein
LPFGGEFDLIAARQEGLYELLGRLRVVLDDENATPPFDHHYALLSSVIRASPLA